MKLTKSQLRKIIKEELQNTIGVKTKRKPIRSTRISLNEMAILPLVGAILTGGSVLGGMAFIGSEIVKAFKDNNVADKAMEILKNADDAEIEAWLQTVAPEFRLDAMQAVDYARENEGSRSSGWDRSFAGLPGSDSRGPSRKDLGSAGGSAGQRSRLGAMAGHDDE